MNKYIPTPLFFGMEKEGGDKILEITHVPDPTDTDSFRAARLATFAFERLALHSVLPSFKGRKIICQSDGLASPWWRVFAAMMGTPRSGTVLLTQDAEIGVQMLETYHDLIGTEVVVTPEIEQTMREYRDGIGGAFLIVDGPITPEAMDRVHAATWDLGEDALIAVEFRVNIGQRFVESSMVEKLRRFLRKDIHEYEQMTSKNDIQYVANIFTSSDTAIRFVDNRGSLLVARNTFRYWDAQGRDRLICTFIKKRLKGRPNMALAMAKLHLHYTHLVDIRRAAARDLSSFSFQERSEDAGDLVELLKEDFLHRTNYRYGLSFVLNMLPDDLSKVMPNDPSPITAL